MHKFLPDFRSTSHFVPVAKCSGRFHTHFPCLPELPNEHTSIDIQIYVAGYLPSLQQGSDMHSRQLDQKPNECYANKTNEYL